MKLFSVKSRQLAVNGFDETFPLVTELSMLDRKNIFHLLSMSNHDVDLALTKDFSVKFHSFCHNFWFTYPLSFKLEEIILLLTINHI